jgi:hypothetical protein
LFYADALRLRLPVYAASLAACALVAAVFFLLRKPRVAVASLLGLFFTVSLTLDGLWYLRPSYTLRDESRALAPVAADGTMFVGYWSHELSLENRALPIGSPWSKAFPLNAWFADEASRRSFLMIVNEDFDGEPGRGSDAQKLDSFPPQRVRQVHRMNLCPKLLGGYRFRATVYYVAADRVAAAEKGLQASASHDKSRTEEAMSHPFR